jgi:acetyl-CoA carboxylase biotin carboxyl carrier protein
MSLDLDQLSALFDLLAVKDVVEFEHEENGVRIRVARGAPAAQAAAVVQPAPAPAHAGSAAGVSAPASVPASRAQSGDFLDVTSPFVGSFYSSPSPDAPPFVEIGSVVRPGQTLCIVEAMKLMNEIEAECAGTVVEAFAQNGKSVEYGQKLFRIKKA